MASIFLFAGIIMGFFLPGYLLNKIFNHDNNLGVSYIVSTVILFQTVFLLGICGINLNILSVGIALALINLTLFLYCMAKGIKFKASESMEVSFSRAEKIALLPVLLSIILIFLKSSLFNNPGDQVFRWYFLAARIFETGSFSYYPPLTPNDYNLYFFTDSFPPIVSFSYFWLYSLFGKAETFLVCIPVTLQFIFILFFGYRLSVSLFSSNRTGIFTVLLIGSSTLLFYSVVLAQETGMTTLSMLALIYFLVRKTQCSSSDAMMAAFAASLGALSREYGVIFIICGIIVITWRRIPVRILLYYLLFCAVLTAPWYIRTFMLTGNPFYSNPVGGLFAINPVHAGIIDGYKEAIGLKSYMTWKVVLPLATGLSFTLGIAFFTGFISSLMQFKRLGFLLIVSLLMISLWIYSIWIPGGLFHSMRILSPAIAVMAVCGSSLLDSISKRSEKIYLLSIYILSAISLFTFFQNIFVPSNPLALNLKDWPVAAGIVPLTNGDQGLLDLLKELPEGSKIISDSAPFHAILAQNKNESRNITVVPLWSPEVRFLFDKNTTFEEGCARLKKCGINYAFLIRKDNLNMIYLRNFQFFQKYDMASKPLTDTNLFKLP